MHYLENIPWNANALIWKLFLLKRGKNTTQNLQTFGVFVSLEI